MGEPDLADAPMVPLLARLAVYENYVKCLNLYTAYLLVTGQITVGGE